MTRGISANPRQTFARALLQLAAAFTLAPGGAATAHAAPGSYPYAVTTTTGMVNDIARQVTGDLANAVNIIGEGVDPHLYKPTRSDVAALLSADVVFYSGLMLEGKMADTLVKVARSGKPVFAVTELLDEQYLLEPPGFAGHYDPHVWMDVQAWSKAVQAVATALSGFDPSNADVYRQRADRYVRRVIRSIPQKQRVLITAHDAFNYFGRAYGIEVRGIQGISTESEAGIQDINSLVDFIVERNVRAVFVETSVADKNVRALIEGARSRGHDVVIGGSLFSDAMGAPGSYEGTYVGMLDHNATIIARALGGEAPAKGMSGKLRASE
jgi:manganese/zinc/iron transport system substrate-binding protein